MSRPARRAADWVWAHLITVLYVALCAVVAAAVTAAGAPDPELGPRRPPTPQGCNVQAGP